MKGVTSFLNPGAPQAATAATQVSGELFLSIDSSGSIDTSEFTIMMDGYRDAFRQASAINAITTSANGWVAGGSFWASTDTSQEISWTLLKTTAEVNAFADLVNTIARHSSSLIGDRSCISCAMAFAINALNTNSFFTTACVRPIINVSGDGIQNLDTGPGSELQQVEAQGDRASSLGIRVNGCASITLPTGPGQLCALAPTARGRSSLRGCTVSKLDVAGHGRQQRFVA